MKKHLLFCLAAVFGLTGVLPLAALTINLDIKEQLIELKPGLKTEAWTYNGTVPGTPIIAKPGEDITVVATNNLYVDTTIHWHGLELPNDQDGVMTPMSPGESRTFHFKAPPTGTFWYHSHTLPVLEQVDMGLYGALIVQTPEDSKYSSDQVFVLDDWYLNVKGERKIGTARGDMERFGNTETVNGKTGTAIPVLKMTEGELHKLRFINASAAAVHTIKISGHQFRVTHTDGHPLVQPYLTDTLVLQPSERFDVELAATGTPGARYEIRSVDRDLGLIIPIQYSNQTRAAIVSPFKPPASTAFPGIQEAKPDFVLELTSRMKGGGTMDHDMKMAPGAMMPMEFMINGKSYPDTEHLHVKLGQVVKIRFVNKDTSMGHPMVHPMHLHGTFFQVVAINGVAPERETWKDTIAVPSGGTADIAFKFRYAGEWMLHCHILDHEDQGLMTMVHVDE